MSNAFGNHQRPLVLHVGSEELVIRRRYEVASISNDILIACWFIAGSIMFFSAAWMTPGTWCFLAGSIELLIRPVIRLSRHIHLQKVRARASAPATTGPVATDPRTGPDSSQDY